MNFDRIQYMNNIGRVKRWWNDNDGAVVLFGTALTAFVTYFYYLILEPLNSDCFVEGFLKYHNDNWAIQLGKWMVPYYAKLSAHIVSPIVYFIIYILCVSVSTILLTKLWGIKSKAFRVLTGSLLMVSPAITGQILYIYLFLAFAMSLLLSVLASYIALNTTRWFYLMLSSILMACALASYQLYIGDILVIVVGTIILYVLREKNNLKDTFRLMVRIVVFLISGLAMYWLVMQLHIRLSGTEEASYAGIKDAGIVETMLNVPRRIKHTYRIFWWYYRDSKLGGRLFWTVLALVSFLCFVYMAIHLIKRRLYWKPALAIILIFAIPPCANFMYLVLPEHGMQLQMTYQMQLLGPLSIAIIALVLADISEGTIARVVNALVLICLAGLIIGYSYCAYSSFRTLDIGSRHIKLYIQNALTHAIEDEKHEEGMPIVFVGFVNDDPVQERNPLREYSYYERAYPFWRDRYEVFSTWREYCWYQYGIDIGEITTEQYENILVSDEFKAMEQYPSSKAYAIIDGCYVVLLDRESVQ